MRVLRRLTAACPTSAAPERATPERRARLAEGTCCAEDVRGLLPSHRRKVGGPRPHAILCLRRSRQERVENCVHKLAQPNVYCRGFFFSTRALHEWPCQTELTRTMRVPTAN